MVALKDIVENLKTTISTKATTGESANFSDLIVSNSTSLNGVASYNSKDIALAENAWKFCGVNVLSSSSQDTPEFWKKYGSYAWFWISKNDLLVDQPNQYGYLFNVEVYSNEICQKFVVAPSGQVFTRGANAKGWNGNGSNKWFS